MNDSLLQSFQTWLSNRKYSASTIRNYLVDINRYLSSSEKDKPFSENSIRAYLTHISGDINQRRYLASLKLFCQFAVDQQIISLNPLKKLQHQLQSSPAINLDSLLQQYQTYLLAHKISPVTIKNYLNDIRQFLNWN